MENQIFGDIQTFLDLNGPELKFTTEPTNVTAIGATVGSTSGPTAQFVGLATALFSGSNAGVSSDGINDISYQWYYEDGSKVVDGTYITGAKTTTLTLSNIITPTDNQKKVYLQADYVPGIAYSTGNAYNEPLNSGTGILTVTPLIEVIAQPSHTQAEVDTEVTLSVNARLTDDYYADDLQYQWYLNGEEINDGIKEVVTETSSIVAGPVEKTFGRTGENGVKVVIPSTAEDITFGLGGGAGGDGADDDTAARLKAGYLNRNNYVEGIGGKGDFGKAAEFSMPDGDGVNDRSLTFFIGSAGNDGKNGYNSGGLGGNSGGVKTVREDGRGGTGGNASWHPSTHDENKRIWAGGGGGGGGSSSVGLNCPADDCEGKYIALVGGGGGGGGASHTSSSAAAIPGIPAASNPLGNQGVKVWNELTSPFGTGSYIPDPDIFGIVNGVNGQPGGSGGGDMAGGGGGGGGVDFGPPRGGDRGTAWSSGSHGGSMGASALDTNQVTLITGEEETFKNTNKQGYGWIKYTGYTVDGVTTIRKTTLSGTNSSTLNIKANIASVQTLQCKITSATASSSTVYTDSVSFVVLDKSAPDVSSDIVVEVINAVDDTTAQIVDVSLANGEYIFTTGSAEYRSFYTLEEDVEIEMDLYGGKGEEDTLGGGDPNAKTEPGEGGYSRIKFKMEKGIEYVIAGLTPDIQAPFLYRKGELVAVVGGGGGGGYFASGRGGGAGGGVNVAGEDGTGQGGGGGKGGVLIPEGTLNADGIFGSVYSHSIIVSQGENAMQQILHAGDSYAEGREGGRATKCSKGEYWAQQGKGACEDLGTVKFRLGDGTEVTNTSDAITRGFKAGYPIIATAGKGMGRGVNYHQQSKGGHGGNGATGGQGGQLAGGGGGSGYQDGSIYVEDTMQGGSTGEAKVVLRLAPPTPIPPQVTLSSIPTSFSKEAGSELKFGISAQDTAYTNSDSSTTFTYQWQYSTDSGNNWIDVDSSEGGTASTLTRYEPVYYSDNGNQVRCIVVATNTINISTTAVSNVCTLEISRLWEPPSFVLSGPSSNRSNTAGDNITEATNISSSNVSGITYTYQWQYSPYSGASFSNIPDNEGGNASTVTRYNPCYYSDNGNQIKCKVTGTNSTTNPIYYDSRDGSGEEYSTTVDSATCSITVNRNKSCPDGWSKEIINKKIGNAGLHSQGEKYNVVASYQLPNDICFVKVYFHQMYGYGRCNYCNGNDRAPYNLGWKMKMVAGVYYKNDSGEWTEGLHSEISKQSDTIDGVGKCDEDSKKSYAFYDNATGSSGSNWDKTDGNGNPVTPYVFVAIRGGFQYTDTECKECWPWSCDGPQRNNWQWIGPVTQKDHAHEDGWVANIYYKVYTYHYESRP